MQPGSGEATSSMVACPPDLLQGSRVERRAVASLNDRLLISHSASLYSEYSLSVSNMLLAVSKTITGLRRLQDEVLELKEAAARDQQRIASLSNRVAEGERTITELNGRLAEQCTIVAELTERATRGARGVGDFTCTVCREKRRLAPFEERTDVHGNIWELWICLNCHAILNSTLLRMIEGGTEFIGVQSDSSDEFYAVDDDYLRGVPTAIDQNDFVEFLIAQYPHQSTGVFLDFGAGRGILSGAAAKHFGKVYAAELSLSVLRKVHDAMPLKERIHITDDYRAIPDRFDAIAAMHTLEHLPDLRDLLDDLVSRLNPGGSLFFQVPMLRKDHLVIEHYTFFTDVSARYLCRELGLETVGVWFDHALDFLTCIARKPVRDGTDAPA